MGFFRYLWQPRTPSSYVSQNAEIQPAAAVATTFQHIDVANFGSAVDLKYPRLVDQPGDVWFEQDTVFGAGISNAFQYVKITATLAFAQVVGQEAPSTDTVVAAGSSTQVVQLTTGTVATNGDVNALLYLENGGVNPQFRRIKSHTGTADTPARTFTVSGRDPNNATNVPDFDQLPYTPTNLTNVAIIRPYNRIVGVAANAPRGIALGAQVATVFGPVLVAGIALVSAVGNVNALVVGQNAIGGAAGVITGQTALYAINFNTAGSILPLFAFAGAGPESIPCSVNLMGQI